jgi:hypothetical protein
MARVDGLDYDTENELLRHKCAQFKSLVENPCTLYAPLCFDSVEIVIPDIRHR